MSNLIVATKPRINSVAGLAASLPMNILLLAGMIARKPAQHTSEWAATCEESFSLYTRTSTINLLQSQSAMFAESNWPFSAYLDLRRELAPEATDMMGWAKASRPRLIVAMLRSKVSFINLTLRASFAGFANDGSPWRYNLQREAITALMILLFYRESRRIFAYWRSRAILQNRIPIIRQIERTYRRGDWAPCLHTSLALLDHIIRRYFQTDRLNVSLQTLRNAFDRANILPSDLKPGFSIWDGKYGWGDKVNNRFAHRVEDDLRLPGVLLSSFARFGSDYYAWYKVDAAGPEVLNRHAIQHCAGAYWTKENAIKLLTFLDLTLRLQHPLEILIHGLEAPWLQNRPRDGSSQ